MSERNMKYLEAGKTDLEVRYCKTLGRREPVLRRAVEAVGKVRRFVAAEPFVAAVQRRRRRSARCRTSAAPSAGRRPVRRQRRSRKRCLPVLSRAPAAHASRNGCRPPCASPAWNACGVRQPWRASYGCSTCRRRRRPVLPPMPVHAGLRRRTSRRLQQHAWRRLYVRSGTGASAAMVRSSRPAVAGRWRSPTPSSATSQGLRWQATAAGPWLDKAHRRRLECRRCCRGRRRTGSA